MFYSMLHLIHRVNTLQEVEDHRYIFKTLVLFFYDIFTLFFGLRFDYFITATITRRIFSAVERIKRRQWQQLFIRKGKSASKLWLCKTSKRRATTFTAI